MPKIIFLLLLLPLITFGQKIKNLPELFWSPISYDNQKERDKFATQVSLYKKGELWLIAGDRDNITLLDKPNGKPTGQYLKFKETAFVIDENKEWMKIGAGPKEDNKFRYLIKAGWVKKKDLLLWPHALRNKDTYIKNIVFTGNKLSNLSDEYKDFNKIKVFDSPSSSCVNKEIYNNIYYIYKEEQGRVLLGTTDYFNQTNAKDILVGWVDTSYIHRWNSRLTLECNWEEPSYNQRQSDSLKRVYGFINPISADLYSRTGSLNKSQIVWDHDPAKSDFPKVLRSDENNRRPIGDVFRFPVFDFTTGYIKSAGLVKIDNGKVETEPIKSHISKLSEATQSRILQEKPRVMVLMYLPLSIPCLEHPYKYVILMSETELEEYAAQLRDLKRAMNAPEDIIREQLYNTVVSLILKMSGDSRTKKQIDNLDFAEFIGWVMSVKRMGIPIGIKGTSIKDILAKKKLTSDELNKWAVNLSAKEEFLFSIVRKGKSYPYSFTVGDDVFFGLNLEDLT